MAKKDYYFGIVAGLLIGLLALPVLNATKSELFSKIGYYVLPFFLIFTPLGLIVANFIGRKIAVVWQIGKFGVIGVLNTLVDWGVLASLIFLFRKLFKIDSVDLLFIGITFYSLYKSVSFIVAVINSYYWNKYWTFAQGAVQKSKNEFLQFLAVSVVGFIINVGVSSYIFGAISPLGELNNDQWGIVGAAIGSALGLIWNFVGYKFIVFKEDQTAPQPAQA